MNLPSNLLRLEIREGKISADFKEVPVKAVLDSIQRQSDIRYQVSAELAEVGVSATFEPLPLEQGLALILAPFNYMILQEDTHHRVVQLLGLRENRPNVPTSSPPPANVDTAGPDKPTQTSEPPASAEFPGAAKTGGTAELPPFIPMTSSQGPGQNVIPSQPLLASASVSNTTGPVAPATGQYRELLPFAPVTNQTGPIPTK